MKRNICCVITARPSYSRIKSALLAINNHPELELQIIVGASALLNRYGDAASLIEEDGFKINKKVQMVVEGDTLSNMVRTTAIGMLDLASTFEQLNPDFVITIADRYETMATAISASYMNIPLIHIQGGELTGSIDEKVRHSITKLADYHFTSTIKATKILIQMGEHSRKVFTTGCPSIDLAKEVIKEPSLNFDPIKMYGGVGSQIDFNEEYLVVLQHPDTTEYQDSAQQIEQTCEAIINSKIPTAWFWPNVDAGSDSTSKILRSFRENRDMGKIHFFKNMRGEHFLKLLWNAKGIIGNSSVGIRECSYLGIPAVNIGDRQKNRERGTNVIDVGYDSEEILNAIEKMNHPKHKQFDNIYGDGEAGKKIANVIATIPQDTNKTFNAQML